MRLLGFEICPFTQRVRAALQLKELPHEAQYGSLASPPPALLEVSREGVGPALTTEEGAVVGSGPIVELLEELHPERPLHPRDPYVRARGRAWLDAADRAYLLQCSFLRAEGVVRMERRQERLEDLLRPLEGALSDGGPFLGGEVPLLADAAWFPFVHRAQLLLEHTDHDLLAALPGCSAYRDRLMALEPLRRSVPDDFDARFVDFYLSSHTHLGRIMLVRRGRSGEAPPEATEDTPLRRCR